LFKYLIIKFEEVEVVKKGMRKIQTRSGGLYLSIQFFWLILGDHISLPFRLEGQFVLKIKKTICMKNHAM